METHFSPSLMLWILLQVITVVTQSFLLAFALGVKAKLYYGLNLFVMASIWAFPLFITSFVN